MIVEKELTKKDPMFSLSEVLDAARDAAERVKDVRFKAGALTVVANVSGEDDDLKKALDFASAVDKTWMKGELLAVIAKTLAEAGNISKAREVAIKIKDIDVYWCVEALINVGRIGHSKGDFEHARHLASRIGDSQLRADALTDITLFITEAVSPRDNGHHHHGDPNVQAEALTDIVKTLAELRGFEDAHMVASKISSAYWRTRAFAAIVSGLAEAIK
ncbi:MAG: hypothetical protein NTW46_02460 [Candidatus Nealsonbacteria bacterium]|nr:hypothetical protein [Candidatus Nealsonbacteria bacterium]